MSIHDIHTGEIPVFSDSLDQDKDKHRREALEDHEVMTEAISADNVTFESLKDFEAFVLELGERINDAQYAPPSRKDEHFADIGKLVSELVLGHIDQVGDDSQDNPRFDEVFCSSCGESFGPGNNGFSHCESHAGMGATDG